MQRILFMLLVLSINLSSLKLFSQQDTATPTKTARHALTPAYLDIAFGVNFSSFRDFATSPLIYSGRPTYLALSHVDLDDIRESRFGASYSFGNYSTNYNQHDAISKVNTLSLNYTELFELPQLSNSRLNVKVGGQFSTTANFRKNELLQNNSKGLEVISTLFGSVKGTLDISRKQHKSRKFLFLNYTSRKRTRSLSYTINLGLVNSAYRNGYVYSGQSAPLNQDNFFDQYQLRVFSGYRINSALDYTVWLSNKNAIQLSYLWEAYNTGGDHDQFEMAAHVVKFSLLYSLK